jgi:mono/diheme cytochrome c family protein
MQDFKTGDSTMKLTSVATLSMVCLMAGVSSAQDAKLLERGMKVYVEKKCANCHSIAGKGNKKGPLDEAGTKLSADEIREWLVNPIDMAKKGKSTRTPAMKPSNLGKEDLDAVVAYVGTLKKK